MEMRGPGADHSGELSSSVASNCVSRPGSDRSFDLTVRRPPHTPDVSSAARSDRRSGRRSHRNPVILALRQHGPDRARHLVGERDRHQHAAACAPACAAASFPPARPSGKAQRTTAIAPVISSRRMSRCPIFEIFPRTCLPPVECCRGTSPSQAAKSRPRLKTVIGGAKVSIAMAVIGPTPGMVCRRQRCRPARGFVNRRLLEFGDLLRQPVDLIEERRATAPRREAEAMSSLPRSPPREFSHSPVPAEPRRHARTNGHAAR